MTISRKQIIKIKINKVIQPSIFKDFEWDDIPQFAVITGVNGSGKTGLLECINKSIDNHEESQSSNVTKITYLQEQKIQKDQKYYHPVYLKPNFNHSVVSNSDIENFQKKTTVVLESWIPKLLDIDMKRNPQQYSNSDYISVGIVKNNRSSAENIMSTEWSNLQKYFAYLAIKKSAEYRNENNSKLIHSIVKLSTKSLIDEYVANLRPDSNDFASINIGILFLDYKKTKDKITLSHFHTTEQNKNIIVKKIEQDLETIFGTKDAPWDSINSLLDKYGFKHKITPPENDLYTLGFNTQVPYEALSTGEKVILNLICSAYDGAGGIKGKKDLLLLDEFDAHLNPMMSKMFVDIIENYIVDKFGMQVIMTTHSPSTASYTKEENLFWMENGAIAKDKDKMQIIHELSSGFMLQESTCPFMSYLIDPTKPYYILVEGYTDMLHLKEACKKLGAEYQKNILNKCNFLSMGGTKHSGTTLFLENFAKDKQIIAIFDNDKSGKEAFDESFENAFSKDEELKPFIKQKNKNLIGILLKSTNKKDYKLEIDYGYITIELLYNKDKLNDFNLVDYENTEKAKDHYIESQQIVNFTNCFRIQNSSKLKTKFARKAKDFIKEDFEGFKPTLDNMLLVITKFEEPKNNKNKEQ